MYNHIFQPWHNFRIDFTPYQPYRVRVTCRVRVMVRLGLGLGCEDYSKITTKPLTRMTRALELTWLKFHYESHDILMILIPPFLIFSNSNSSLNIERIWNSPSIQTSSNQEVVGRPHRKGLAIPEIRVYHPKWTTFVLHCKVRSLYSMHPAICCWHDEVTALGHVG